MNATSDILEQLTCNNCRGPLSCGPIYLTLKGYSFCGRCGIPTETAVRNRHYELTARFLRFPCKFEDFGCEQTLSFSDIQHRHEAICPYHPYKCPESKLKLCDWIGLGPQLLEHYNLKHPTKILNNPCTLPLNITETNEDVFLLVAFGDLFILHRNVTSKPRNVDISIEFLGDPEMAPHLKYTLDIIRNEFIISKPGHVYHKNSEQNEHMFLTTAVHSILEVMEDYGNINMTITVRNNGNDRNLYSSHYLKSLDSELFATEVRLCRNNSKGCNYSDVLKKCEKHERYFCHLNETCPLCSEEIISLENHFSFIHSDILYTTGMSWLAKLCDWQIQYSILECPELQDYILCRYKLCWNQFSLAVLTPIPSDILKNYKCYIKIISTASEQIETFVPEETIYEMHDWSVSITLENRDNMQELKIQIDLLNIEDGFEN